MVENIGGVNSSKASRPDSASTNTKRSLEGLGKSATPESGKARESVDVELSEAVKRAEDKASYDEVRVRELKAAIESGNYPLDNAKIAEKFADLESLL
tara:strand:- start:155 stop:448 length:294 start_codon:yes stop_codon:yes gene_type:complete